MTGSSTIAAVATGGAPGGIGVVRVSGPAALESARAVASALPASPTPRHAYFTPLVDGGGRVLDEGLALYFAAPASFTGEDVVELQAHGAPRVLSLLLEGVLRHPGVRPAEPGEFTRRAFLNGRLDLARAEAVADLVAAESEAQVRAAAAQLSGQLSARLAAVRQPLVALHADLEGVLDFPDEAEGADAELGPRLATVRAQVEALLADGRTGALVRRGARVVLYGPVNAGKSTLFNRLVGAARALVDAEPGTTRDVLEARVELGGLAVTLVDTAGLRGDPGRLEALGIARAREALRGADVAVLLVPPESTAEALAAWRAEAPDAVRVELISKADQPGAMALAGARFRAAGAAGAARLPGPDEAGEPGTMALVGARSRAADAARLPGPGAAEEPGAMALAGARFRAAGAADAARVAGPAEAEEPGTMALGGARSGAADAARLPGPDEAEEPGTMALAGARLRAAGAADAARVAGSGAAEEPGAMALAGARFRAAGAADAARVAGPAEAEEPSTMALGGARSGAADAARVTGPGAAEEPGTRSRHAGAANATRLGPPGRDAMAREGAVPASAEVGGAMALEGALPVSGETGLGVDALQAALAARLGGVSGAVRVTSERHLDALRRAADALERAQVAATASTLEVVSGEVGLALAALADITGEDVSSELLDAIFARFCIGK